jgi:hypothetical protein
MSNRIVSTALLVTVLAHASPAAAQTDRVATPWPRADASVSIGLSETNEHKPELYDNWYHTWNGTFSGGFYWTEHLKTEVEAGLTSEGRLYGVRVLPRGAYAPVEYLFSTRSVGVAQQYQFGHNARFHPYLTAGVRFQWVKYTEERAPAYLSTRTPPYSVLVEPEQTIGPVTELEALPFVGGGFKAYFNERAFFRTDLDLGLRGGVKQVTIRSGLGVDF